MTARALRAFGLGVATVLVSALLASLALTLIMAPPDRSSDPLWVETSLSLFVVASLVSAPFTALGLALFGAPADYVLRTVECRNPLAYAACGLAGGLVLTAIVTGGDSGFGPLAWTGMGYGLTTGLVFWALFRRWRPAKDEADPQL